MDQSDSVPSKFSSSEGLGEGPEEPGSRKWDKHSTFLSPPVVLQEARVVRMRQKGATGLALGLQGHE